MLFGKCKKVIMDFSDYLVWDVLFLNGKIVF